MKMTTQTATYLYLVTSAIDNGTLVGPFTTICPECGEDQREATHYVVNGDDPHLVVSIDPTFPAVVIGCEGYHVFEVRADGTVGAKSVDNHPELGDVVTGVHDGDCNGDHAEGEQCFV